MRSIIHIVTVTFLQKKLFFIYFFYFDEGVNQKVEKSLEWREKVPFLMKNSQKIKQNFFVKKEISFLH